MLHINSQKRYAVTIDAYVYANNDKEAEEQSRALCKELRESHDNQAQVLEVTEHQFGQSTVR